MTNPGNVTSSRMRPFRSHEIAAVDSLRRDPEFAAQYLEDVCTDGDERELQLALRRIERAFGRLSVRTTSR